MNSVPTVLPLFRASAVKCGGTKMKKVAASMKSQQFILREVQYDCAQQIQLAQVYDFMSSEAAGGGGCLQILHLNKSANTTL